MLLFGAACYGAAETVLVAEYYSRLVVVYCSRLVYHLLFLRKEWLGFVNKTLPYIYWSDWRVLKLPSAIITVLFFVV